MNVNFERFIVISGGPGSGKSTLIDELEQKGFSRSIEAGRAIIKQQMSIDGPALPWRKESQYQYLFAELMLSWEQHSLLLAEQTAGLVFFDRSIIDVIGYLNLRGLPVPAHMEAAAQMNQYNRTVFLAPPWKEIFAHDTERKQDFDEAVRTFNAMEKTYRSFGYEIALLPLASVEKRASFILDRLPSVLV